MWRGVVRRSLPAEENCQARNETLAAELGLTCTARCYSDSGCQNRRKLCLCVGPCGLSCIRPEKECPELPDPHHGQVHLTGRHFQAREGGGRGERGEGRGEYCIWIVRPGLCTRVTPATSWLVPPGLTVWSVRPVDSGAEHLQSARELQATDGNWNFIPLNFSMEIYQFPELLLRVGAQVTPSVRPGAGRGKVLIVWIAAAGSRLRYYFANQICITTTTERGLGQCLVRIDINISLDYKNRVSQAQ